MLDGSGVKLPKDWISESQDIRHGGTANLAKLDPGSQSDASKKSDLITVILANTT